MEVLAPGGGVPGGGGGDGPGRRWRRRPLRPRRRRARLPVAGEEVVAAGGGVPRGGRVDLGRGETEQQERDGDKMRSCVRGMLTGLPSQL